LKIRKLIIVDFSKHCNHDQYVRLV